MEACDTWPHAWLLSCSIMFSRFHCELCFLFLAEEYFTTHAEVWTAGVQRPGLEKELPTDGKRQRQWLVEGAHSSGSTHADTGAWSA